jgi:hypothetical protein
MMEGIDGTYRDGRIELEGPVDWPEGARVTIVPHADESEPAGTKLPSVRLPDGKILDWSDTPEFRAALIAQMDSREPVQLTAEEEAEWRAAHAWIGNYSLQAVRHEMGLDK